MDTLVLAGILILLLFGIFLCMLENMSEYHKKEKSEKVSTDRLKLILDQKESIVESVDSLVDELIEKASNTYMILNVNYDKEKYINSKETEQLISYIKGMVKLNMTPEIRELISMVRVINEEKDLEEYLDLKIKIYVLSVIVKVNSPL